MKPVLLCLFHLADEHRLAIGEHFEMIHAETPQARADAFASRGPDIQAVLTNGTLGLTAAEMDTMPRLSLAAAMGAGYEGVDVDHAMQRGVVVTHGPGTNDDCVADHAMAMLLSAVRRLRQLDLACRQGVWRSELPLPPNVSGKKLGIVGLGTIGRKIAKRGAAFDLDIGYHNRSPRAEVPYRYFDSAASLAAWCDFLVVITPGGAATRHLIDAKVLAALGPQGFLVNVGRGTVVDTAALVEALKAGRLGGVALDVYEGEPSPPTSLFEFENVTLTPHMAGWSPEAVTASVHLFVANARRHFAGEPVLTPVPELSRAAG
ncbi:MAG: gyaR [Rhizobacter sp.]|nr:gyaR [Rhizobacter sp.]